LTRIALALTLIAGVTVGAQEAPAGAARELGLNPALLLHPTSDSWPTYNGDYSGRRFSPLRTLTTANVKALSLAWVYAAPGGGTIKSTPLLINGVLYFTTPDHGYAVEARTGRELWHYVWPSKGGNHLSNRGFGAYGRTLFMETPDCHLAALDMRDGSLLWSKELCNLEQFYYASNAPLVVRNHVLTGVSGDDMDNPGYVESHDPITGDLQWRWYTVPQHAGDPGSETWPNEEAMRHGGGMTWQPYTYDPDLNLLYVTTGNPQPVMAYRNRPGTNLFTASVVALNPDTGAMAWAFQSSPQDTHDWDATETAVLFDATINGRPRKLLAQAARNGKFFVLDRTNGQALISTDFVQTNWSSGFDEKGQPIPKPGKMPQVAGALVSPDQGGATNWQPPSLSPETGLFYVSGAKAYSVYYLYDPSDTPAGWAGFDRGGYSEPVLQAIDYRTGKIRWTHRWAAGTPRSGLLSTAGNLLFSAGSGGIEALNATTGDPLWHARLGAAVTNGPMTYDLEGYQHVVVAAGPTIYAFVLNK
jgi:alcohol dehydrogenase (cytochrome c)